MHRDAAFSAKPNRWILLCLLSCWFAAYATPLIRPVRLDVVCSGAGLHLVAVTSMADSQTRPLPATIDCPDCFLLALPPAAAGAQPEMVAVASVVLAPASSHIPALSDLPPPARGPPFSFDHT